MFVHKQPHRSEEGKALDGKSRIWAAAVLCLLAAGLLLYVFWGQIDDLWARLAELHRQKERFRGWIFSFGAWGPAVFIGVQVLQVVFSPIPGEVTGFLGGYVYGALAATILSTIGLTLGSAVAFFLGRQLGRPFVEKLIPVRILEKFDFLITSRGAFFAFLFFAIPGFPKDYMCYLLGLSPLRASTFLTIAFLGRIPGTIMLGIQGAGLYEEQYGMVVALLVAAVAVAAAAFYFQEPLRMWMRGKSGEESLAHTQVEQKQGRGDQA